METRITTISPDGPTLTYHPITTAEAWPPVFLYGVRPLSLDAAQTERELAPDELDQNSKRLRLDCPNGSTNNISRTPEEEEADDQCRQANLFPAEWYRWTGTASNITIFGGTYTPSAAPEKTWRCEMTEGDMPSYGTLIGGDCSLWDSPGGDASATTAGLGRCDISRQYVPVRLTAGEMEAGGWGTGGGSYWFNPTVVNNEMISTLSLERCADPTSLVDFAAAAATVTPAPSGTGTTGSATGSASASRGERAGPAALFCVVLACASVAGLLSLPL